jgi:hypothetical protein
MNYSFKRNDGRNVGNQRLFTKKGEFFLRQNALKRQISQKQTTPFQKTVHKSSRSREYSKIEEMLRTKCYKKLKNRERRFSETEVFLDGNAPQETQERQSKTGRIL